MKNLFKSISHPFLAVYVPSNTTFLFVSFNKNSTSLDKLFSREALAAWIVTLEKLIDPATSEALTYCLLTLSYLAHERLAPPKDASKLITGLPEIPSVGSLISILNWIFPDFSIETSLNGLVYTPADSVIVQLSYSSPSITKYIFLMYAAPDP
jgi:hypothetical protein